MRRKIEFTKETILPNLVFIFSVINIINNISNLNISIVLSLIGICGTILFYNQNNISSKLIYIWLIAQVIIIEPIFNLNQLGFTLSFSLGFGDYNLSINFLPLLFLGLIKVIESANLIGKQINLMEFRENTISEFLPIRGIITQRLDFNENKNWLLIDLENQLEFEGKKIDKVLIKNKDAEKSDCSFEISY